MRRQLGIAIAIVCGLELVIAVAIGGAGFSVLFGWEAAIVAVAASAVAVETIRRRLPKPAAAK